MHGGVQEPDVTSTLSSVGDRVAHLGDASAADYLFVVMDASAPAGSAARYGLEGVTAVSLGRGTPSAARSGALLALALPDRRASAQHARLSLEADGWWIEDLQSKNGTFVAGAAVERQKLVDGAVIEIGHTFLRFRAGLPGASARGDLQANVWQPPAAGLATLLPELEASFADLVAMARTAAPVVILGETGTGKDVTARAYHALTGRPGPLVPVNCGALPGALVEASLYGHRRGAFSGASADALGLVRAADGGTLFLDEIGDLPLLSQAALLRVIEAREVIPVGSTQPVHVDVRIVAATHRDLRQMVRRGAFRADLLARLSGHVLRLPPLRERIEDLGLLVDAAFRLHAPGRALGLQREAARHLLTRKYPLNTRELVNALGRAIALTRGELLGPEHLEKEVLDVEVAGATIEPTPRPGSQPPASRAAPPAISPRAARNAQLELLLTEHQGNVSEVARVLGKTRPLVYKWLQKAELDPGRFRP